MRWPCLEFWQPDWDPHRLNAKVVANSERIFTLMGLRTEQMVVLYIEIGKILGKCPNMAMEHCRELHEMLRTFFPEPGRESSPFAV